MITTTKDKLKLRIMRLKVTKRLGVYTKKKRKFKEMDVFFTVRNKLGTFLAGYTYAHSKKTLSPKEWQKIIDEGNPKLVARRIVRAMNHKTLDEYKLVNMLIHILDR